MRRLEHAIGVPEFTQKMNSGEFRTPKSSVPEDWGKQTEAALDNYLATEYKEPDYEQYNTQKNNFGNRSALLEMFYRTYTPIQDLNRNSNKLDEMDLDGGDKFFHCAGNYEASKRGTWESIIAKKLSTGREMFQFLDPNAGLQDASDDMEANRHGIEGAKAGKSLLESCPRNPRDYYK